MSNDVDWNRLARYVAGESPAAEIAEIERWIAGDGARAELVAELKRACDAATDADRPVDVDAAWARAAARLDSSSPPTPRHADLQVAPAREHAVGMRFALRAAAAIGILAGGMVVWQLVTRPSARETASVARIERTAPGERKSIRLSDGTDVLLGVASILRVPAAYGGTAREVELEGEALFRVVHDSTRPFAVRAGESVAEDLGTEFGVRAYRGGDTVRVVVTSGSVALQRSGGGAAARAVLSAGQVGIVARGGDAKTIPSVDIAPLLAWTDGRLVFDDAPLSHVVAELARWYDIDVRVGDAALARRHLTATFSGEPLDEVLRVITLSLGIRHERNGRTITFLPSVAATTEGAIDRRISGGE